MLNTNLSYFHINGLFSVQWSSLSVCLMSFRIERLARNICREVGQGPLIGLCVLKGGYQFFGDLMDCIRSISASGGNFKI